MTRTILTGLIVLSTAVAPVELAGQSLIWGGYGRNTDDATRLAAGETFRLGYGVFRPTSGLAATLGLPLDPDTSSRWGSVTGWLEPATEGVLGVSASGSAFAFSDPILGTTGVGSILSLDTHATHDIGPAELWLRVGGRHGARLTEGVGSHRLLGGAGAGAALRTGPMTAQAELDHWWAEEDGYTQVAARVGLIDPGLQAWAGVSHWLDTALSGRTGWDVGLRLPVTERLALLGRGGVLAQDILFWIPPQRTWSVTVQFRTGAERTVATVPVPILRDASRKVAFRLPEKGLEGRPGVAGTFSHWQVLPMERSRDGWRLELMLEPGVHEYAFVSEDGTWFVPEGTPGRKPDGFGGHVAVLIVQ